MTVVATTAGQVRGLIDSATHAFRGIPYARPPVGPLRFAAPVAHDGWNDVRDAVEFGPPPPQPGRVTPTDEWLTVNVWTPDPDASGLPVMVWIYGGRFTTGAADESECDGARLAAGGVVVVSFNYRLGAEGFMLIDGAVPNRGLLDQVAALRWVHDNIAGFGGDPDNVTVFGQSAGAGSVVSLMVMPAAAGLFHRGIAESVPAFLFGSDVAADIAAVIAGRVGRRPTVADLTKWIPGNWRTPWPTSHSRNAGVTHCRCDTRSSVRLWTERFCRTVLFAQCGPRVAATSICSSVTIATSTTGPSPTPAGWRASRRRTPNVHCGTSPPGVNPPTVRRIPTPTIASCTGWCARTLSTGCHAAPGAGARGRGRRHPSV